MATKVARFLLDEASTGTTPTTCADDTGNGNDLTIDYSSGDLEWTSITEGNGLDFLAEPVTNDSAICILDDVATNGNVGAALDGATQVWFALSMGNITGTSSGARLLAVGTDNGNTDVSIVREDVDNWHVRWDMESGGDNFQSDPIIHTAKAHETLIVQIDTTQADRADALKFYIDGTELTAQFTTAYVQNSTLGSVNSTDRNLTLGNRGDRHRNVQGQIYYAEMGTGVLTAQEIQDIHDALIANNDADWDTADGFISAWEPVVSTAVGIDLALSTGTSADWEPVTATAVGQELGFKFAAAWEPVIATTALQELAVVTGNSTAWEPVTATTTLQELALVTGTSTAWEPVTATTTLQELALVTGTSTAWEPVTATTTLQELGLRTGEAFSAAWEPVVSMAVGVEPALVTGTSTAWEPVTATTTLQELALVTGTSTAWEPVTATVVGQELGLRAGEAFTAAWEPVTATTTLQELALVTGTSTAWEPVTATAVGLDQALVTGLSIDWEPVTATSTGISLGLNIGLVIGNFKTTGVLDKSPVYTTKDITPTYSTKVI